MVALKFLRNEKHSFLSMLLRKYYFLAFAFVISLCSVQANNIQVQQAKLVELDTISKSVYIQFDISWDNSWRSALGVANYDGAWIFAKYKPVNGNWKHITFSTNLADYSILNDNGVAATIEPSSTAKAALIYRTNSGDGTNNWQGIKLKWNYSYDDVPINQEIVIQVFAIEMVYIPQGAFFLGSGGTGVSEFYTAGSNSPYLVQNENAITVSSANGNLYYNSSTYGGDRQGIVPALFPKGYKAFWCMKYEITLEQYSDFLNTLTINQKATRFANNFNNKRNFIKLVNGVYGCDANNNSILNEADDGQNIACNYLSWADGAAYADWAGLRAMTEFEYEKACRGTAAAVPDEFAWGTTTIIQATDITNQNLSTEVVSPDNANCVFGEILQGPVRVGNFARENSSKESAGASFYGVMDLTGNLWERTVTIGNTKGRSFTNVHGNGSLDVNGNADINKWPGIGATGSGFRGGDWKYNSSYCKVSDRIISTNTSGGRNAGFGFRCVYGLP
ncbi:MAG TPA: SUMF1/EgtB/PvdO family nonheme iron enzyme [Candidatus Kapabacteria bacterium]|nr:SUMF1/EgtB/PvdO family nonheme iron enzyme [Candidatus Kapabacteria bacterium]HPO64130.1 SUMF1/EgtB/PvdO family nonheme iron enzyme [Candidatus Kapabacteria bacterium]